MAIIKLTQKIFVLPTKSITRLRRDKRVEPTDLMLKGTT